MLLSPQLSHTGEWFLGSGIQQPNGGVARYYHTDRQRNAPISTEITGYAVSALVYMHSLSHDQRYLDAAARAARFLARVAWNPAMAAMPFEIEPARFSYFFDCGIIVRGLLSAWRATGEDEFLGAAAAVGGSMARDFASENGDFHPVIGLPAKIAEPRDARRWSRSPGCYQLKSAMAWWDLFEATGEPCFREHYQHVLESSLAGHLDFVPGHPDRLGRMDRLHAYCYFLEGLLPRANEARCAEALFAGIAVAGACLRNIAPEFVRSDVYAQLLRIRLFADWAGAVALDRAAAEEEAGTLAGFQSAGRDPRIDGGYWFGRKGGELLPFINPVSAAFAGQALELWESRVPVNRHLLI
ncbi:MAG TPA: hypothetical protein VMJ75_17665 [Candidatus Acidoferrales bacterium]|nr:hypothetical protein [Candidatus Acidoferrales bacterium]